MKLLLKSNKLLVVFLVLLCIVNLLQGFFTELLSDEAYYWVYSNFLDWGYFDHPPMVAAWITISKFFISSGELSVRFLSAFTLSFTFYIIWLLIKHPSKEKFMWLFVLLLLSTSLFNVYGFITVPDTPLLFFMAVFLYAYQLYLERKSLLSYVILAVSMACMMYSKYQAILIIIFVILSNLKVLTDYKLWLAGVGAIILFFPHLFWQFENDYPSFKYHLFERRENVKYKFEDTLMHFVNMIVIIGFTFPIVYKALYKNLKNKDLFNRALNFIAVGFIVFFFISTFKGHAQAQWIVPISISLIVITFNYLVNNKTEIKLFKTLAFITIGVTLFLRIAMAIDGVLPRQFDMHGNKAWVAEFDKKLKETNRKPLFLNSYQYTSIYWFYSGKQPCSYNAWRSRKNQYDLLGFNKDCGGERMLQFDAYPEDSVKTFIPFKNNGAAQVLAVNNYTKHYNNISFKATPTLKVGELNKVKVNVLNASNVSKIDFKVALRDSNSAYLKTPDLKDHPDNALLFNAYIKNDMLVFKIPTLEKGFEPAYIQIVGKVNKKTAPVRMSKIEKCNFITN